jgi:hypothetical protein
MKKSFCAVSSFLATTLIFSSQFPHSNAASSGPKLSVNCGALEILEDEDGAFKRFNPKVSVTYTGKKLRYWVYHTDKKNTKLSVQSRLEGDQTRSGSSSQRGSSAFNWQKDFHNNLFESRFYSSKYLEFTMVVKDSVGRSATYKCIYKDS